MSDDKTPGNEGTSPENKSQQPVVTPPAKKDSRFVATIKEAWELSRKNMKPIWSVVAVVIIVSILIGLITKVLHNLNLSVFEHTLRILFQLFQIILMLGLYRVLLMISQREKTTFDDLFYFLGQRLGAGFGLAVLYFLMILVMVILMMVPVFAIGAVDAHHISRVAFIWMGVVAFLFMPFLWALFGAAGLVGLRDVKIFTAFKSALKYVFKNYFLVLGLIIAAVLSLVVGALLVIVGLIWAVPFAQMIPAVLFRGLLLEHVNR